MIWVLSLKIPPKSHCFFKEKKANPAAPKFPEKMGSFHGINGFVPIPNSPPGRFEAQGNVDSPGGRQSQELCSHFPIKNWGKRGEPKFPIPSLAGSAEEPKDFPGNAQSWNSGVTQEFQGFGMDLGWIWDGSQTSPARGKIVGIPGGDSDFSMDLGWI